MSTKLHVPLIDTLAVPLGRFGIFRLFAMIMLNLNSYSIRSSNYYCSCIFVVVVLMLMFNVVTKLVIDRNIVNVPTLCIFTHLIM